jgi:hypothetical protein
MVTGAEDRARHRTPGNKRFVHVDLSWRGTITPNYMAIALAFSAVLACAQKAKAMMQKGRGR